MIIAKPRFAVLNGDILMSDGWTTRKAAIHIAESDRRYAIATRRQERLARGWTVIQGGYDAMTGEGLRRTVYVLSAEEEHATRSTWAQRDEPTECGR